MNQTHQVSTQSYLCIEYTCSNFMNKISAMKTNVLVKRMGLVVVCLFFHLTATLSSIASATNDKKT